MLIGYLWLCKCKHSSIVKLSGCPSKTVTSFTKFFRELIISTLEDDNRMIGGEGIIVEIDESKFGKRKYHRGHIVKGAWVCGGIENTIEKRFFVEVVNDRTAATLHELISRHVAPGSIVHTDLWRGYIGIEELGVVHKTVNHSRYFKDPITNVHTNTIEGLWNGIKQQIPARNRTKNHITNHLFECIWRKNNHDELWNSLLNALKTTGYFS